ncbi:hypothetical protein K431DRAFT_113642 [Polychaeton citri CBS 116435]|uniref:Uncharacterized protein n=1 Tax=Polychaeton citri CBS 116435 TaxID=1314669 RepID=A0A9P4Q4N5_9PEZI|nr:hypothetical protein K431DRAFT_113642 [Polychaeton citri CBS 116435]
MSTVPISRPMPGFWSQTQVLGLQCRLRGFDSRPEARCGRARTLKKKKHTSRDLRALPPRRITHPHLGSCTSTHGLVHMLLVSLCQYVYTSPAAE